MENVFERILNKLDDYCGPTMDWDIFRSIIKELALEDKQERMNELESDYMTYSGEPNFPYD